MHCMVLSYDYYTPSIKTWTASFIMLSVVKRTRIEKIKVQIGSTIFHSG